MADHYFGEADLFSDTWTVFKYRDGKRVDVSVVHSQKAAQAAWMLLTGKKLWPDWVVEDA